MAENVCNLFNEFFSGTSAKVKGFRPALVANCVFNGFLSYTTIILNIVTIHAIRKTTLLPNLQEHYDWARLPPKKKPALIFNLHLPPTWTIVKLPVFFSFKRLMQNYSLINICYLPAGRSVWWKIVTEVLEILPEAVGRGQHFQDRVNGEESDCE